jgi:hypothetical protein
MAKIPTLPARAAESLSLGETTVRERTPPQKPTSVGANYRRTLLILTFNGLPDVRYERF